MAGGGRQIVIVHDFVKRSHVYFAMLGKAGSRELERVGTRNIRFQVVE